MSKVLKALIVDDEESSRVTLRNYVTKYCENVDIVGEASQISEAQELIESKSPHLLFLDVEMPYGNAFDLLDSLEEIDFEVIFVTAYSHYAMDALNLSAAYYLLKPLDIDELIKAVNKVQESLQNKGSYSAPQIIKNNINAESKQLQKIVLPEMNGFEIVELQSIIYCKANDNLTDFYFENGKKKTICKTLKSFDEMLSNSGFMRIHKSTMININHVTRFIKGKNGSVKMSNNDELEIAMRRKKVFLDRFSKGL